MTRFAKQHASITADTAKAQNVDFLDTDFSTEREGTLTRISISVETAVAVRMRLSTGADVKLQASALGAEVLTTFEFVLDPALTYNFYTPDVAGTTVNYLTVQEVES